jgi:hypothetical protein
VCAPFHTDNIKAHTQMRPCDRAATQTTEGQRPLSSSTGQRPVIPPASTGVALKGRKPGFISARALSGLGDCRATIHRALPCAIA